MISKPFFGRLLAAAALVLAFGGGTALAQPGPITNSIVRQNTASTGDCTTGSCVVVDMFNKGGATVEVRNTYTASGGLSLQRSNLGVSWETITANAFVPVGGTGTATITSAATGTWQLGACVGFRYCRIIALGAVTGQADITVYTSSASVGGTTSVSGGVGDANAANQVTGNASLASIDGKMVAGSGATSAATQRVVAATDSPEVAGIGGVSDAAATQGSTGSVSAKLRTVTSQLNSIDAGIPAALGATTMSAAMPVTIATDDARIGIVTETAPASDTASSGLNGRLQRIAQNLTTLNTSVNADPNYTQAPGSAAPSRALAMGARSGANLVAVSQANATAAINVSTATTTQLVALSSGQVIHVTAASVISAGTGNITFVYGTGTNCGTGTTSITGAYPLIANAGLSIGSGLGPVFVVPAGNALCVTTSAAVQMSGHVAYTQFTP